MNTLILIRNFCEEFQLELEVEFTCYDLYDVYIKNYFAALKKSYEKDIRDNSLNETNAYRSIDQILEQTQSNTLLHTLALISICGKYINGQRNRIFQHLQTYLIQNGTPFNFNEIRAAEYQVFEYLNFHVNYLFLLKVLKNWMFFFNDFLIISDYTNCHVQYWHKLIASYICKVPSNELRSF